MAPGRRKNRATSAAAVRMTWKVGDLALAKMKGFPPWPAVISDPQKWGYSSDKRKLFVYFFGTKQIAFCNHSDVEVFTEEKKRHLLGKKHGKGVDFSRAVDEIIENFENLKSMVSDEQCPGNELKSHSESTEDLLVNDAKELKKESLITTSEGSPSETLPSPPVIESQSSDEIFKCSMDIDVSNSCEVRKDSDHQHNYTHQMSKAHVTDDNNDGCPRSDESVDNCSKPKSVDAHDTSSEASTLMKNGRNDEDMVINSSNDQGAIELECLSKGPCRTGLETQGKAFVRKKRRKPSKNHITAEVGASRSLAKEEYEKYDSWPHKNDCLLNLNSGDEHLPLLKRARVRMGNISPEISIKKFEEKVIPVVHNSSPSSGDSCRSSHVISRQSEERMCVSSCSVIEMESVLPPTKRLHRALEAMSANAAEASSDFSEPPLLITLPSSASVQVDLGQEVSCKAKIIASPEKLTFSPNSISKNDQTDESVDKSPNPDALGHLMGVCETNSGGESSENESSILMMRSEAAAAQKSFESLMSLLTNTEESINFAAGVAIECMQHGIGDKVVHILLQNLEKTENFDRKLLLFSLVDAIIQCSPVQKGVEIAGNSYASLFEPILANLLLAAAPPEANVSNNHLQCLKVLKSWNERGIFPDSVLSHHIQQFSEYRSDANVHSPSVSGSQTRDVKDHDIKTTIEVEQTAASSSSVKHRCILEDVDGEVEMEDVSPKILTNDSEKTRPHLPEEDKPPYPRLIPSSPPPVRNNLHRSCFSGGGPQMRLPSPNCHYPNTYFYGQGCAWRPTNNSGPVFAEKAEGSPTILISSSRTGWTNPPRAADYGFPVAGSRPPFENSISRVAGAPGFWSPR